MAAYGQCFQIAEETKRLVFNVTKPRPLNLPPSKAIIESLPRPMTYGQMVLRTTMTDEHAGVERGESETARAGDPPIAHP